MTHSMPDAFAAYSCLKGFDLRAADGHAHAAAVHDAHQPGGTSATGNPKFATNHIYSLNLRTHALTHLSVADQVTRRKQHEMRTLKRLAAGISRLAEKNQTLPVLLQDFQRLTQRSVKYFRWLLPTFFQMLHGRRWLPPCANPTLLSKAIGQHRCWQYSGHVPFPFHIPGALIVASVLFTFGEMDALLVARIHRIPEVRAD